MEILSTTNMRIYPIKKNGVQRYTLSYFPTKSRACVAGVRTKTYYQDEYDTVLKAMNHIQKIIDEGASFEEICKAGGFTM